MTRYSLLLAITCSPHSVPACTAFKVTQHGRTLIGCNEDAWSINAQVRFEQGHQGQYGAIYFGHFNGSPLRAMTDQMGMNEAGLVFDGFVLPPQAPRRVHGGKRILFAGLMPTVLRSCADVHEAADLLRTIDLGWLATAMIFLADRNGETLIVESDTMLFGNDTSIAVGNWRMSTCTDPGTIPIPRLQAGRAVLAAGTDTTVAFGTAVLERMKACRSKLGAGTLFSTLFDPVRGQAHLFFYHDFRERVSFDLKTEIAEGDRVVPMASLFGGRPEYDALLAYKTPFHQRWLWWTVALLCVLSLIGMLWAAGLFVIWVIACIRSRTFVTGLPWLVVGVGSALASFLCGTLLLMEGVYYFGLGDAVDRIHPVLVASPLALLLCVLLALVGTFVRSRHRRPLRAWVLINATLIVVLTYWGLLWPW